MARRHWGVVGSEMVGRFVFGSLFSVEDIHCSVVLQTRRVLDRFHGATVGPVILPVLSMGDVRARMRMSVGQKAGDAVFLAIPARNVTQAKLF